VLFARVIEQFIHGGQRLVANLVVVVVDRFDIGGDVCANKSRMTRVQVEAVVLSHVFVFELQFEQFTMESLGSYFILSLSYENNSLVVIVLFNLASF
jgi:hypothetical protein